MTCIPSRNADWSSAGIARNQREAGIEGLEWEDRVKMPESWLRLAGNAAGFIVFVAACIALMRL